MVDQHMQEMKAQVEKMRATLEQMKTNLAKVKDPALKQQAQLDVDLWEGMVTHMEGMVLMMSGKGQLMPPPDGRRYNFRGDDDLTMKQAMELMDELRQLDELGFE